MAVYEIPTLEKAKEIMDQAYLTPWAFHPIIFDLDESINADDVRTRISQCQRCNLMIRQNLGEYNDYCPRCGEDYPKVLEEVILVIQGSIVVYTVWRNP